jgi:hypothetical protein
MADPEILQTFERQGRQGGSRYGRIDTRDEKIVVSERDLKFYVNPADFVDTGLFSGHRETRQMVRAAAGGKDVVNLYSTPPRLPALRPKAAPGPPCPWTGPGLRSHGQNGTWR